MRNIFSALLLLLLTTVSYSQNPGADSLTVTFANKTYHVVRIGNQQWMKENLDVGTMIKGVQDQQNNNVIEKYYYNDDPSNGEVYGGLYTWNEAMNYSSSAKSTQGICPKGWHIPTLEEFKILQSAVNNEGNPLKDITQGIGIGIGTNTSGFSALLNGSRGTGGHFTHLRVYSFLWTSSEYNETYAYVNSLDYNNNNISLNANGKEAAFGVRCIKGDAVTAIQKDTDGEKIPTKYSLSQNYPNPFNPGTTINYTIQAAGHVTLKVYDMLGREVTTLVNELKQPGKYNIEFRTKSNELPSGIYLYTLNAGNYVRTMKMMLLK